MHLSACYMESWWLSVSPHTTGRGLEALCGVSQCACGCVGAGDFHHGILFHWPHTKYSHVPMFLHWTPPPPPPPPPLFLKGGGGGGGEFYWRRFVMIACTCPPHTHTCIFVDTSTHTDTHCKYICLHACMRGHSAALQAICRNPHAFDVVCRVFAVERFFSILLQLGCEGPTLQKIIGFST